MIFADRTEAGKKLAAQVAQQCPECTPARTIVLALPRGGLPVAFEIAKTLGCRLDLIFTHKLGAPGNPELAIGAVAEDGNAELLPEAAGISRDYIKKEKAAQLRVLRARIKKYRKGKPLPQLKNKTVILVDDGIATGSTMDAAIVLARNAGAQRIIVAVPVLPPDTLARMKRRAEIMYLKAPAFFMAIGRFYVDFPQLSDREVLDYLEAAAKARAN